MTTLQQAIIHGVLVLIAVIAVVVLAATGNGNSTIYGLILAITGFGNIGVAGVDSVATPAASQPAKTVVTTSPSTPA